MKETNMKKMNKEDFYVFCQELYETTGNSCQLDEEFIELLYKRLYEDKN
jgi:hypothetical protein